MRPLIMALVALTLAAVAAQHRPLEASPMIFARAGHSAVRLPDGRVFITGGTSATGAEIYDPATDRWSLAEAMRVPRQGQGAVLLADGRVLVAGGSWSSQMVEIYDPATNRWSLAAPLQVARGAVALTTLADGRVLVVGGNSADSSIEIYDPVADSWTPGSPAPIGSPYGPMVALTLQDGRVLVTSDTTMINSLIALYTPATDRWAVIPTEVDYLTQAAPLPDGRVLLLGRSMEQANTTALGYDPATDKVEAIAQLPCLSYTTRLTALLDGRVLALDALTYGRPGCYGIYDQTAGRWWQARGPAERREAFTATDLGDGTVLLAGRLAQPYDVPVLIGSSERYDLAAGVLDQELYLPLVQQHRESYPTPTAWGPTPTAWGPTPTAWVPTPTVTVTMP